MRPMGPKGPMMWKGGCKGFNGGCKGPDAGWWGQDVASWHEALVGRLKELLRGSRQGMERWSTVCKGWGKGTDPTFHDPTFIETFFGALEAEGWNLPPMPGGGDGYGPMKGGWKGKAAKGTEPYAKGFGCCNGAKGAKGAKGQEKGPVETNEKIFIGGIPPHAGEEDIVEYFSSFGEIANLELKVFQMTGQHRGFAFLTFTDVTSAQAAIDSFDDNMVGGKWVEVKAAAPQPEKGGKGDSGFGTWTGKGPVNLALPWFGGGKFGGKGKGDIEISEKIFVGALPKTATEDDIRTHFSTFGEVVNVQLKKDFQGFSRGFAFVTFASVDSARAVLENPDGTQMEDRWLDCKPADPDAEKGGFKGKGKGKESKGRDIREWTEDDISEKIFLGKLPEGTTEPEVRQFCERYGRTREVALKYDSNNQFRGFAFISYESADAARELLSHADAAYFGGQLAEVRPARPAENYHDKKPKKNEPLDESAPTPITSNVIRVCGLLPDTKQRDVFKLFYNWSITRIRDCGGDDCFVEFTSPVEAQSAYRGKWGAQMGGAYVKLMDASQDEFARAAERLHNLLPKSMQGKGGGKQGSKEDSKEGGIDRGKDSEQGLDGFAGGKGDLGGKYGGKPGQWVDQSWGASLEEAQWGGCSTGDWSEGVQAYW